MVYTTLLPFSGSNKRATWRIQSGYGPVDIYICFEIDLVPERYTLKEIRMTTLVFTLNVCSWLLCIQLLSPLYIIRVLHIQKELHLTQCTLSCDPEDCFRYCILTWILNEPECYVSVLHHELFKGIIVLTEFISVTDVFNTVRLPMPKQQKLTLSHRTTYKYICRTVSPLNSRMTIKVVGGGGFNSGG